MTILFKKKRETAHNCIKNRNKAISILSCTILLCLILSACNSSSQASYFLKKQSVSNEEISNYLNENYFFPRAIELLEITDVTEYPGETDNKIMLTCTTVSSNYYATQTANWDLSFELFEGTWVGTAYQMGVNDCKVRKLSSEEVGAIVCPQYGNETYFDIISLETDLESKVVTAQTIYYKTFPAYYISTPWTMKLYWDSENMLWTYDHVSTYRINEDDHGVYWQIHVPDISGHYDVDKAFIFDIERVSETGEMTSAYIIKNYSYYYDEKYFGGYNDSSPFSLGFHWDSWRDGLTAEIDLVKIDENGYRSYQDIYIEVNGNELYVGRVNSRPIATLVSEFVPQESYLQGTYS